VKYPYTNMSQHYFVQYISQMDWPGIETKVYAMRSRREIARVTVKNTSYDIKHDSKAWLSLRKPIYRISYNTLPYFKSRHTFCLKIRHMSYSHFNRSLKMCAHKELSAVPLNQTFHETLWTYAIIHEIWCGAEY
jgi:hypothetical protein